MGRNKAGVRGYVPYNYVEVYDFVMKDNAPTATAPLTRASSISSSSGQVDLD